MTDSDSARPKSFHSDEAAALQSLQGRMLKPAVTLPGLKHPALREVLSAAMPGVRHSRTSWPDGQEEHLLIDLDTGSTVRITIGRDPQHGRARTFIAEIGPRALWDELVSHLGEWERNSRTIPPRWPDEAE